jgi:hypothetical protein
MSHLHETMKQEDHVPDQMLHRGRELLAEDARMGDGRQTCAICTSRIAAGAREVRLPASESWVHLHPCLSQRAA